MVTEAIPSGFLSRVPAKITSSIRAPRRRFRGLLAQNPTDRIAEVGLAAPIGPDDGSDTAAAKFHFWSVVERLEPMILDRVLSFSNREYPPSSSILGGTSILTGLKVAVKERYSFDRVSGASPY